uniref:Two pore calcium channel protein 1A n=3 Tax=Anthurium amnicola TaxID=1678845 RepID=A0A1D1Y9M5_9ARAE
METPLITEEGSSGSPRGGGSGSGSGSRRLKGYQKRSDAIAYGTRYQRAAALVDLAEDGIGLPEEVLEDQRFEKAAKFYFIYVRFNFLWSLNLFALLLLNFIEKPLWCSKHGKYSCENRDYFFLGELPYLTISQAVVYEGITLFILVVHTFFPVTYEGCRLYWKSTLNILKVIFLFLLVCDLLVYALYLSPVPVNYLPLRVAPYIRVAFIAINIRELRSSMVILAGMMGMYLNVLALWLLFILFSSWLAYVMFEDTQQGKILFSSFGTTLYQMFVLFTTSNNPDVWIPAYKSSRWSCLFFVLYVLIGVYFITNLILAVVYDSFKVQLAQQVAEMDSMRIRILRKAFSTIDKHNHGFLNKNQCICLFKELNKYRSLPKISREDFELIFSELDDSGDFKINVDEFTDLCNAIALKFQKEAAPSWFENYPYFYDSRPCKGLKAFVRSSTFGYIVAFILLLNLIAVIIETTLDIQNNSAQTFWQAVEFFFGWLYVLEMALKIFSYGFDSYWLEGQNRFDFVITLIIVIGETTTFFFPQVPLLSNGEWIRYLLIARMLRLIRLLMHIKQYRAFVATFLTLIPSLMPYLGIIFCVQCIYCSLGVQLFGGIVNMGNSKLDTTDLSDNDYLLFNFNDYPNGMVTLFNLLVMGNWQVWMQSYKDLTGTSWTLAYFVSFYLITVLLLLNLVVAFVLEAFFAEMELEKDDEPQEVRVTLEGKNRRRHVGIKSRSRTVDILLHHMLSAELSQTQSSKECSD